MSAAADIARLGTVFALRERRAKKALVRQRQHLARVREGIAGSLELRAQLQVQIAQPPSPNMRVAQLAERHEQARHLGEQLHAIEHLHTRALINQQRLEQELSRLRIAWRKSQLRCERVAELTLEQQRTLAVLQTQANEDDALERWCNDQANSKSRIRAAS